MLPNDKIVRFDLYCNTCKHKDKTEEEDPCYDCLFDSVNTTIKPTKYEEEDKK